MPVLLETLDAKIASTLADWNLYTTLLALVIVAFLAYPIVYPEEPDTHPLLLARQSSASPVRSRNESAVYRSPEIPHGYPLKTGLNVKEVGAPRWQTGKNGDLRDVWREVCRGGSVGQDGKETPKGMLLSVHGKDPVEEHDVEQMSREINVVGKHLSENGAKRVAIYIPNSVEYLLAIFACSFYGLTPILLPFNQSHPKAFEQINLASADTLICEAGTLPLDDIAKECPSLRLLTWVVEKSSRHMDWAGTAPSNLKVSVWHELISSDTTTASTLPPNPQPDNLGQLVTIWQPTDPSTTPTLTTFTHANLASATSALLTSLPLRQRLSPADLLLPATSLSDSYTLCWTLAALYAHTSIALTSVASPGIDLQLASRSISPTLILSSAETLARLHHRETSTITTAVQKLGMASHSQAMAAGRMPTDSLLFRLLSPRSNPSSPTPGKLRLILTAERMHAGSPALSSTMLSDLRIFTRARIVYALTGARVAGAVCQSHVFDYRREDGVGHARFGAPVGSVEVSLKGEEGEVGRSEPEGEIVVKGPAVAGEAAWRTGCRGKVGVDGCLGYV